jgi:ATP-binding cassette subfamily B protein
MADRIVVLEGGRIVEMGSHDELLDRHGVYSRLFHMQAEGYR